MRTFSSIILMFILTSHAVFPQTKGLFKVDVKPILDLYPYQEIENVFSRKKVNEILSLKVFATGDSYSIFYLTPFGIFKNMVSSSGDILTEPICLVEFLSEKTLFNDELTQFDVEYNYNEDTYFIVGPVNGIMVWKFSSIDNSLISKFEIHRTYKQYFELLSISDELLYLSFFQEPNSPLSNEIPGTFIYKSTDGGKTWFEFQFYEDMKCLSMEYNNNENSIEASFIDVSGDENVINFAKFNLTEQNWSDSKEVYRSSNDILSQKFICTKADHKWIIYNEELVDENGLTQSEILYSESTDNGISWSQPDNFTNYKGEDILINVSKQNEFPIATFSSTRNHRQRTSFFGGLVGNYIDNGPPFIQNIFNPELNHDSTQFILRTKVLDFDKINSVVFQNERVVISLYDDGEHDDSLKNDNIYGNRISKNNFLLESAGAIVELNSLKLPFEANGNLAGTKAQAKFEYSATDQANNKMAIIGSKAFGKFGAKFSGSLILYSAGFFLSGYDKSKLWVNGMASLEMCETYKEGKVNTDPSELKNIIYTVRKEDTPFGYSWQSWKNAVEQGAYYYDGNKNGVYDPIDDNGNGIWETNEDRPDLLYDVTYFTVYNDGTPSESRNIPGEPLGIEIRQTVFTSGSLPELNNTVIMRYSILNTGMAADTLNDVIFSIYANPEIGYSNKYDDLIGCDTTLQSGFAYNDGDDDKLGANPPSIFYTLLQGPIKNTGNSSDKAEINYGKLIGKKQIPKSINQRIHAHTPSYSFDSNVIDDPRFDINELRNKMEGKMISGELLNPCDHSWNDLFNVNCEDVNPYIWFSGDPVKQTGWLSKFKIWQRHLTSTGKFDLIKGEPQDIIIAYTVGQGDSHLSSITDARERVKFIFEEYNNNFPNSFTPPNYEEIYPKNYTLSQNYPNPFNPNTTIEYSIPNGGTSHDLSQQRTSIIVYDILGREIKTLVNEMKAPGNYEVNFNASQLASGVYFYRLESGSFMQTKKMMVLK